MASQHLQLSTSKFLLLNSSFYCMASFHVTLLSLFQSLQAFKG